MSGLIVPASGWKEVKRVVVSAATEAVFDDLDPAWAGLKIIGLDISSSGTDRLHGQFSSDNGSTWISTINYDWVSHYLKVTDGSETKSFALNVDSVELAPFNIILGGGSRDPQHVEITLIGMHDANEKPYVRVDGIGSGVSYTGGRFGSVGLVDAFRVYLPIKTLTGTFVVLALT